MITDENYRKLILAAPGIVVVDFWAPWCGPCRTLTPMLERMATRYPTFPLYKANADQCSDFCNRFGVSGLPTVMAFYKSRPVGRVLTGTVTQQTLDDWYAGLDILADGLEKSARNVVK